MKPAVREGLVAVACYLALGLLGFLLGTVLMRWVLA